MNQNRPVLYLGKDISSDAYFFLANKAGIGRFIKYVRYPHWCGTKNLVDFLDFGEAPKAVVDEVDLFVNGKIEFEVIPKVRGRKEKNCEKIIQTKYTYHGQKV